MFCIYCGATLPEGATKCDVCGSEAILPPAERSTSAAENPASEAENTADPVNTAVQPIDEEKPACAAPAEEPAPEAPQAYEDLDSNMPEAHDPGDTAEELFSGEQLPEPPPVRRESYALTPQEEAPTPYEDNYMYEEYEDDPPHKKRSLKWLWIALPIAAAVIATVVGIAIWFNTPMQKLARALDANDYTAVALTLPQLSEAELRDVAGDMKTYAAAAIDRYNNGETDYQSAYDLIDRLRRLFPDSGLENELKRIETLKASKDAFNEAQYLEESGELAGAINRYGSVISDDTNYEEAQKQIAAVRADYKQQVLEEAQALADDKDYRGAEAALLNSSDVLGDDADIAAKLEELKKAELDDYVSNLLKTAQSFADEGDYTGAIQLLKDATKEDERFTQQIDVYLKQYKEKVLKEAAGYAENSDYEAAVAALEKSQELLPDDADIAAKIEEYEAMYPVLLTDLSPSGGMDCATGWTATDSSGNSYGNGLSFALYPVIQKTIETEYAPNGQYKRLSGTWVIEGESADGFSASVRVYVDGALQYEVTGLTRDGAPTGMNLVIDGAETVRIEVEGNFSSLRSTGYVYLADATFGN